MSNGVVFGVTGKMFMGSITGIDGTGGERMKGVEGRRFEFDTGMRLEMNNDAGHFDVVRSQQGPGILRVPLHDMDDDAVHEQLRALYDVDTIIRPKGGNVVKRYGQMPSTSILILPVDNKGGTVRAVYIPKAKLHPDTQKVWNYSLDGSMLPESALFVACSESADTDDPWMVATASEIESAYFGGGGGE